MVKNREMQVLSTLVHTRDNAISVSTYSKSEATLNSGKGSDVTDQSLSRERQLTVLSGHSETYVEGRV